MYSRLTLIQKICKIELCDTVRETLKQISWEDKSEQSYLSFKN